MSSQRQAAVVNRLGAGCRGPRLCSFACPLYRPGPIICRHSDEQDWPEGKDDGTKQDPTLGLPVVSGEAKKRLPYNKRIDESFRFVKEYCILAS